MLHGLDARVMQGARGIFCWLLSTVMCRSLTDKRRQAPISVFQMIWPASMIGSACMPLEVTRKWRSSFVVTLVDVDIRAPLLVGLSSS